MEHIAKLGFEEKGGRVYYTAKVGVSQLVYIVAGGKIFQAKVKQIVIMHDIKDGLHIVYHCDNGCSYTETIENQNTVFKLKIDAMTEVMRLNRKGA